MANQGGGGLMMLKFGENASNASWLVDIGDEKFVSLEFRKALRYYGMACKTAPDCGSYRCKKAFGHLALGEFGDAVTELAPVATSMVFNDERASCLYNLACTLLILSFLCYFPFLFLISEKNDELMMLKKMRLSPIFSSKMFSKDLLGEILRRLPVKELMRFKCVCRTWLSVITNPLFTKAYSGGSRGLLFIEPSSWQKLQCYGFLHRIIFNGGGNSVITTQIIPNHIVWAGHWVRWKGYTNIVDGLICFYRGKHSWLYNITTREMVQLPDSTQHAEEENVSCDKYHFGFDPVNKLYKLLRVYPNSAELLTIGKDFAWRNIDSHPPEIVESQSVCLDGVLCWMDECGPQITAFDLAIEKFIFIPPPDHDDDKFFRPYWKLINFGQSIILTKPGFLPHIMRYCRSHDDGDGTEKRGFWVEEEVRDLSSISNPMVLGELPNGKMLIYNHWLPCPSTLYFVDPSKRQWEEAEVSHTWEQLRRCGCRDLRFGNWFYFEDNIISLTQLTSSNRKVVIGGYDDDDDDQFLIKDTEIRIVI
ncbi:OLC1v1023203C1 [Oldenlandia corymbosa var. corymbosa]|uniref:OLC1v1023203C1 n=1 Tax=Oldenlandia corymbosa var. corymbosa TaxID=529605 RepID=A0AAV1C278_OLDCO|nr:OLC1v1023203C1 [Oldenlandia corymbosa var. corymbosa]